MPGSPYAQKRWPPMDPEFSLRWSRLGGASLEATLWRSRVGYCDCGRHTTERNGSRAHQATAVLVEAGARYGLPQQSSRRCEIGERLNLRYTVDKRRYR